MPVFYMHLQFGSQVIVDQDGQTFATAGEARASAIQAAREIMSQRVAKGQQPNGGVIRIANQAGHTLMLVPFAEALTG